MHSKTTKKSLLEVTQEMQATLEAEISKFLTDLPKNFIESLSNEKMLLELVNSRESLTKYNKQDKYKLKNIAELKEAFNDLDNETINPAYTLLKSDANRVGQLLVQYGVPKENLAFMLKSDLLKLEAIMFCTVNGEIFTKIEAPIQHFFNDYMHYCIALLPIYQSATNQLNKPIYDLIQPYIAGSILKKEIKSLTSKSNKNLTDFISCLYDLINQTPENIQQHIKTLTIIKTALLEPVSLNIFHLLDEAKILAKPMAELLFSIAQKLQGSFYQWVLVQDDDGQFVYERSVIEAFEAAATPLNETINQAMNAILEEQFLDLLKQQKEDTDPLLASDLTNAALQNLYMNNYPFEKQVSCIARIQNIAQKHRFNTEFIQLYNHSIKKDELKLDIVKSPMTEIQTNSFFSKPVIKQNAPLSSKNEWLFSVFKILEALSVTEIFFLLKQLKANHDLKIPISSSFLVNLINTYISYSPDKFDKMTIKTEQPIIIDKELMVAILKQRASVFPQCIEAAAGKKPRMLDQKKPVNTLQPSDIFQPFYTLPPMTAILDTTTLPSIAKETHSPVARQNFDDLLITIALTLLTFAIAGAILTFMPHILPLLLPIMLKGLALFNIIPIMSTLAATWSFAALTAAIPLFVGAFMSVCYRMTEMVQEKLLVNELSNPTFNLAMA